MEANDHDWLLAFGSLKKVIYFTTGEHLFLVLVCSSCMSLPGLDQPAFFFFLTKMSKFHWLFFKF